MSVGAAVQELVDLTPHPYIKGTTSKNIYLHPDGVTGDEK